MACRGVAVLDFLLDSGQAKLMRFDNEDVGFEHWAPCCKLMSRARGWPINLGSGEVLEGHQAVRSKKYPRRFQRLPPNMLRKLRNSNRMFDHALSRLEWRGHNLG